MDLRDVAIETVTYVDGFAALVRNLKNGAVLFTSRKVKYRDKAAEIAVEKAKEIVKRIRGPRQ